MCQDDILTLCLRRRQMRALAGVLREHISDNISAHCYSMDDSQREDLEDVLACIQLQLNGYSRYSRLNF